MDIGGTIAEFCSTLEESATFCPSVSKWSVGMHVHHCCLAMLVICNALLDAETEMPRPKFSLFKSLIFLFGKIPRGRGKAPKMSMPDEGVSTDRLAELLDQSERAFSEIENIDPKRWFRHPIFGVLNRKQSVRFIQIHNRHHLKIIREILSLPR